LFGRALAVHARIKWVLGTRTAQEGAKYGAAYQNVNPYWMVAEELAHNTESGSSPL
jgi:hypothetical protein